MEHNEPWKIVPCPSCKPGMGCTSWMIEGPDMTDSRMSKEHARRIVACVNACAGIGTEQLEQFIQAVANSGTDELEWADARGQYKTLFYLREA